jgi:hypothetical protein
VGSMKTNPLSDLSIQIEQLILDQIAAFRVTAHDAMDRAFAAGLLQKEPVAARAKKALPTSTGTRGPRRGRRELEELSEKLYEAVCAHPGEAMAVFARALGVAVSELQRPMAVLRESKRVRSVGCRHLTRYFPLTQADSTATAA